MARLPDTYSERQTPRPGRSIATYRSGQVADAISEAGAVVTRIGEEYQREQDAQAVLEARRKLDEWERTNVLDPEKGAVNRRGKDAFGVGEVLGKSFDETEGQIASSLQSDRQRRAFREMAAARKSQVLDWSSRHELQQREAYDEGQFRADLQAFSDNAAAFPERAPGEIQLQTARIQEYMKRKGRSTEEIAAAIKEGTSRTHASVIRSLIDEDPAKASEYMKKYGASMLEADRRQLEKPLKQEADSVKAERLSASWAALPFQDQLTKAADINDPDLRQKTILKIKETEGLRKIAQQDREKGFSDQAWQLVGQGKKVPATILDGMDGRERVQLQDYQRQRAEHYAKKGSEAVKTDPVVLAKVYDLMRDKPEDFKSLRMEALAYKVSGSDMEQIARIQRDMTKPDKEKDVATTSQLIGTYTAGMKPEVKAAFQSAMFTELQAFEDEKKRPPTFKEKQQIGDRLAISGEVMSGSMFLPNRDKRFFEAAPDERARFVPDISDSDRALIVEALKTEGIPTTEAEIVKRFKLVRGFK